MLQLWAESSMECFAVQGGVQLSRQCNFRHWSLTPVDKVTPNGHVVSYGNTSGVHEMTIALLGIDQNAMRWEKLGLGTASDILHRTLLVLRHAQRLPAHRRPPHAIFLGACAIKMSLYHPCSQRHWLHVMHDAFVAPFTDRRPTLEYCRPLGNI